MLINTSLAQALPSLPGSAGSLKIPTGSVKKIKDDAVAKQKEKVAQKVNAEASKAAEFHVGAPISNQLARIAKTKKKTADGDSAVGTFAAQCLKKNTELNYDCLIKPDVEVRK
jgi:hypothetical protein